jgi:hypothetical protein
MFEEVDFNFQEATVDKLRAHLLYWKLSSPKIWLHYLQILFNFLQVEFWLMFSLEIYGRRYLCEFDSDGIVVDICSLL